MKDSTNLKNFLSHYAWDDFPGSDSEGVFMVLT